MNIRYKNKPAEIIKHFRGRYLLRFQPFPYKPWVQVAHGSKTYLLSLTT